jgi:NADP-dependent 3-hydroxy acid dehydrogenase YdfG
MERAQRDEVMIVTGASGGIGAACAARAVGAGYRVVLAARDQSRLAETVARLGGGDRAVGIGCDVTSWDEQQSLVDQCLERFGRLDVVVANAGTNARMGLLESTPEAWRSVVLTNVLGPALTVRATLPHLLDRGTGHYVFIGSLAASGRLPGSVYGATKAAVASLAESVRAELLSVRQIPGIRVTLVELGAVATAMTPADRLPFTALGPDDVAASIVDAVDRPDHVGVDRLVIRPAAQQL